jgi:hypothetical protein
MSPNSMFLDEVIFEKCIIQWRDVLFIGIEQWRFNVFIWRGLCNVYGYCILLLCERHRRVCYR